MGCGKMGRGGMVGGGIKNKCGGLKPGGRGGNGIKKERRRKHTDYSEHRKGQNTHAESGLTRGRDATCSSFVLIFQLTLLDKSSFAGATMHTPPEGGLKRLTTAKVLFIRHRDGFMS